MLAPLKGSRSVLYASFAVVTGAQALLENQDCRQRKLHGILTAFSSRQAIFANNFSVK